MSEIEPRPAVYGIETEYTCLVELPGNITHELVGTCHSVDYKLGLYDEPKKNGTSSLPFTEALESLGLKSNESGMLSNGGRFYIDPSGPEYATPETATAEEAVHRTFDGDEILFNAFSYLYKIEKIEGFQINRRVVDHNRSSRGIHLNTSTTLEIDEKNLNYSGRQRIGALAALNVAKGAIFGSGGLLLDENGVTEYHHSPRLSLTNELYAHYSKYRKRPLVRVPFKEDINLSRIETVTSDALNFAWPIRASLVMTNALVQMLELYGEHYGLRQPFPVLVCPQEAARTVGLNGNAKQVRAYSFNTGLIINDVKPLDIIREISEIALTKHSKEAFLDDESVQVLNEVIDVADRMTVDETSVAKQVESVARKGAMDKKMEEEGLTLDSEKICRYDYYWDMLGGGLAESLRKRKNVGWQGFTEGYSPAVTKERILEPPQDTRAKLRGDAIYDAEDPSKNKSTWNIIELADSRTYLVPPLSTARLDGLFF